MLALAATALSWSAAGGESQVPAVDGAERQQSEATTTAQDKSGTAGVPADKPLAAFQSELLDLAFEAGTALPVKPHIKTRSQRQADVVATCLELDQPTRAAAYSNRIENWLRGLCYADFAFYCAQRGQTAEAQRYLDVAAQIAEREEDWRRDTVRVKIAGTYVLLGQTEQAARFEADLVPSELGKAEAARSMLATEETFDDRVSRLQALIATDDFDQVRNALDACALLFDRFYDNRDRRTLLESLIKGSWNTLPAMIRIDLTLALVRCALNHKDQDKALALVNEASAIVDSRQWAAQDRVVLMARLAGLRHQAGEGEKARTDADAALALFDAERSNIVDVRRARALRPLAEAYLSMGDKAAALAVYRKAVEDGAGNPNSRPRAEDLCATCSSMAKHIIEPDAELWARMREIQEGLGDPW